MPWEVIWLCACVRYCRLRGWCLSVSLAFFVFHFKFTDTPIGKNADPPPHTHAVGGRPCCPQPTATTCVVWSWCLKGCKSALAVKGSSARLSGREGSDSYVMLMSPNKDETAVHGCHCQGDMAVRMRKVLQTAGLVFECVTCFFRVSTKAWQI